MTVPVSSSVATANLWGGAISSIFSAFGSMFLTDAKNAALKSQANIARMNAQLMERKAESTFKAGEQAAVSKTMQYGQTKSKQKAALAANGIAIGEGSAAELTASTDIMKEMDKNTITRNTVEEAWGFKMQAVNYENQAIGFEGQMQDSGLNFMTTLLQGASQVIGNYGMYQAQGVFDTPKTTSTPTVQKTITMPSVLGMNDAFKQPSWGSGVSVGNSVLTMKNQFLNPMYTFQTPVSPLLGSF